MSGPALRPGVRIIEQSYRGEHSLLVKDPVTHKYFRFRPAEAAVLRAFDGTRSVDEIAVALAEGGLAISSSAIAAFARTLAGIGLLERTLLERTGIELERLRTERRRRRSLFRGEWLRMRWSVGDADGFFDRITRPLGWAFTRPFVIVSVVGFLVYAGILAARWPVFSAAVAATFAPAALDPGRIAVLVLTFFGLTFVHELAHGVACKRFGGEVHELGFMLLYLTPAFYCNVNDAWSFPERKARLWVTAAGTWVELLFTAVAAVAWALLAPDTLLSEIALAIILVGGFSALLTNANPLLPLDGYFALVDYLEIPNLRQRSAAALTWWLRRHVLRLEMPAPEATERERRIFLAYGALAAVYITLFLGWIALAVVGKVSGAIGFVGGALAVGVIVAMVWRRIVGLWRGVVLAVRARSGGARWRAWRRRGPLLLLGFVLLAGLIPWDLTSSGRFAVAPARTLAVTASDSGVVLAVYAEEGKDLAPGAPVGEILDLGLARSAAAASRSLDSLGAVARRVRARAGAAEDALAGADARAALARLAAAESRLAQGRLRARIGGTVVTPHPELQVGRLVGPGDTLVLIQDLRSLEARVQLRTAGAVRVESGQRVRLIGYEDVEAPLELTVATVAPAGSGAGGPLEARVPLPPASRLRVGSSGEARVMIRRSTLLGALWWAVRSRVRNDLLL